MHPSRGLKGRGVTDRQPGGCFSIFGEVFCIPSKKMFSVTSCLSANCLIKDTIFYNVSDVNFIFILVQYFVISKYLQFLTQFWEVSHSGFGNFSYSLWINMVTVGDCDKYCW